MSGPSDEAIEAATPWTVRHGDSPSVTDEDVARDVLDMAHAPWLGLDRSVCLRDVLVFCRSFQPGDAAHPVADAIEREFGGSGE